MTTTANKTGELIAEMRDLATRLENVSALYDEHFPDYTTWSAARLRAEATYLERNP